MRREELRMPKILQMFKRSKRQKERLRRALGLPDEAGPNVIQFPEVMPDIQEEYPDYEVVSRWLKLADDMLSSSDRPNSDGYDGNSRKKA